MKKLFSVLLVAVLMLSFVTASLSFSVFAEGSDDVEASVTEESANDESVTEESNEVTESKDGKFDMTLQSLTIMGFGMVGIFVVTVIIVCFMYLLCLLKDKKEQ